MSDQTIKVTIEDMVEFLESLRPYAPDINDYTAINYDYEEANRRNTIINEILWEIMGVEG